MDNIEKFGANQREILLLTQGYFMSLIKHSITGLSVLSTVITVFATEVVLIELTKPALVYSKFVMFFFMFNLNNHYIPVVHYGKTLHGFLINAFYVISLFSTLGYQSTELQFHVVFASFGDCRHL